MTSKDINVVMQVVRGQKRWTTLQSVGLNVTFESGVCQAEGKGAIVVAPTVVDFAWGFIHLREDPSALQQWAAVMLAASEIIDFVNVEDHPLGDLLIEALWDAAYNRPLSNEVTGLITKLTNKNSA